jgi:flagellar basal-body rod protein FlgB
MDLNKLPLFDLLIRRVGWLGQRQDLLAQNIANADTPDYLPQDLQPIDFRRALQDATTLTPARTQANHLAGAGDANRAFRVIDQRLPYEAAPNGNAVILEEQLMKVAETQMDYQLMTNLYRKQLGMIRITLGRGQG